MYNTTFTNNISLGLLLSQSSPSIQVLLASVDFHPCKVQNVLDYSEVTAWYSIA